MIKKRINVQMILTIVSVLSILGMIVLLFKGWEMGLFVSEDALQQYLEKFGMWSWIIFILLQIIQVVIPIIPGGVTLAAGVLIFGPWFGFLYNYIGICVGSVLNFLLARRFGKTFILKFISEKTYQKYEGWLEEKHRFDKLFAMAIFFPIAPDDFLCMLAGLTDMTLKKFTTIILLGKPASMFLYSIGLSSLIQWITSLL